MAEFLGMVKNHGFDATDHERREQLQGQAVCTSCDTMIDLWAETECWKLRDGKWHHLYYCPAMGVREKCHILIVDNQNGTVTEYQLPKEQPCPT